MEHKPTGEQEAILDAFPTGDNLVIEAGAGTGKTSTLKMAAQQRPNLRGLYLAYNKPIQLEAARTFPASVTCSTAHSLAYGSALRSRLGTRNCPQPRVPSRDVARILGINGPFAYAADRAPLAPDQIARVVTETVDRFCRSADSEIRLQHVPYLPSIDDRPTHDALAKLVMPYAKAAWADLQSRNGRLYYGHNVYLKTFQMSSPKLPYDYLMVDEAQDLNPVVKAIVEAQQMQVVMVGDRAQAINGWNGAVDAMQKAQGKRLWLTQSFRFGPQIADEANKWLAILGAEMRISGFDKVQSTVGPLARPDAILCRSNSACIKQVMSQMDQGRRVFLQGGADTVLSLAYAAKDLKDGRRTDNPELAAFADWREVQDYAENDSAGSDLKVFVNLVDQEGEDAIICSLKRIARDERGADMVVSTAHKAKGREWDGVRVADDFREPTKKKETDPEPQIDPAEAMLAYVTVTRGKKALDRGGLAWVDSWVPGGVGPAAALLEVVCAPEVIAVHTAAPADLAPEPTPVLEELGESGGSTVEAPAELVLSWTADPCPKCGYLTGRDGICVDCTSVTLPALQSGPEPAVAPFPVDSVVRYRPRPGQFTNITRFTVAAVYLSACGGWQCDLRQPDGRLQRGIRGEWLEVVPPGRPVAEQPQLLIVTTAEPVSPVASHCRRCGSNRCLCGPAQKRKFLALQAARTADEGRAAFEAYWRETGTGPYAFHGMVGAR